MGKGEMGKCELGKVGKGEIETCDMCKGDRKCEMHKGEIENVR